MGLEIHTEIPHHGANGIARSGVRKDNCAYRNLDQIRVTNSDNTDEIFRAKLNLETSRIAWKKLLRFFAAGTVIAVGANLDLVEVAYQISIDNKAQVEAWMTEGRVAAVSDELAKEWLDADALLWTVVVRPWVLVQLSVNA